MKPPIPITDARFCYVQSHLTNIRATFERVRKQINGSAARKDVPAQHSKGPPPVDAAELHQLRLANPEQVSNLAAATLAQQREGK